MKTPGPYEAIVLADSIASGVRLTTLCCTFPRIVLAEFNTHRVFSRNSASSRAIPVKKRIEQIRENPYVPLSFGKNKRGMSAAEEVGNDHREWCAQEWLKARDHACQHAEQLASMQLHKQWANRLLEPFAFHTCIVSATEWDNYFALRISEHAQPEIRWVAKAMYAAIETSEPWESPPGEWHLPLVKDSETMKAVCARFPAGQRVDTLVKLSVARCAAVSYERHMEQDIDKELARYEMLLSNGHMSPFEHAAQVGYPVKVLGGTEPHPTGMVAADQHALTGFVDSFIGNFAAPWIQHRKMLPGEAVFGSER